MIGAGDSGGTAGAAALILGVIGALLALVVLTVTSAAYAVTLAAAPPAAGTNDDGAGTGAGAAVSAGPPPGGGSTPSRRALDDIPAPMLALYQRAAPTCPGLDWSVLAGIGSAETDHGRSRLPGVRTGTNFAGAAGPMQFLFPTFRAVTARHPPPPGGAHPPSPYDPSDAVFSAAAYLCDSGAGKPGGLHRAIWTYNHSESYIADVLRRAASYRAGPAPPAAPAGPAAPPPR